MTAVADPAVTPASGCLRAPATDARQPVDVDWPRPHARPHTVSTGDVLSLARPAQHRYRNGAVILRGVHVAYHTIHTTESKSTSHAALSLVLFIKLMAQFRRSRPNGDTDETWKIWNFRPMYGCLRNSITRTQLLSLVDLITACVWDLVYCVTIYSTIYCRVYDFGLWSVKNNDKQISRFFKYNYTHNLYTRNIKYTTERHSEINKKNTHTVLSLDSYGDCRYTSSVTEEFSRSSSG